MTSTHTHTHLPTGKADYLTSTVISVTTNTMQKKTMVIFTNKYNLKNTNSVSNLNASKCGDLIKLYIYF